MLCSTSLTHCKWSVGVSSLLTAMLYGSLALVSTCSNSSASTLCAAPWPFFVMGWLVYAFLFLFVWDKRPWHPHSRRWKELASELHEQQRENTSLLLWSQAFRVLSRKSGNYDGSKSLGNHSVARLVPIEVAYPLIALLHFHSAAHMHAQLL